MWNIPIESFLFTDTKLQNLLEERVQGNSWRNGGASHQTCSSTTSPILKSCPDPEVGRYKRRVNAGTDAHEQIAHTTHPSKGKFLYVETNSSDWFSQHWLHNTLVAVKKHH